MDGHHNHHHHDLWDCSQAVTINNNTASSILWSNNNNNNNDNNHQQQVIDESFLMMSNSSSTNFLVPEHKRIISDSIVSNLTQEAMSFSCPSVNHNPFADFIIADLSPQMPVAAGPPPSCSLESLDCLLSATNSNTDTGSIEDAADEGISAIFSEYQNLQNNIRPAAGISAATAAANSGESISGDKAAEPVVANPNNGNKRRFFISTLSPPPTTTTAAEEPSGFRLISDDNNIPRPKKLQRGASWSSSEKNKLIPKPSSSSSSNINFSTHKVSPSGCSDPEPDPEAIAQMKEMIYRAAAFRPVNLGLETAEKPRRKNVRISSDPQTVAARQRRERISERIRVLQRLVPGGSKMDTASMLDEAASYLKFLRSQVKALEGLGQKIDSMNCPPTNIAFSFNPSFPMQTLPFQNPNHHLHHYH